MTLPAPKEYVVSVSTNNVREAIAHLGSALYDLLEQSLMTADEDDESDFDQFARETFNVLARHPHQLSYYAEYQSEESEADPDYGSAEADG